MTHRDARGGLPDRLAANHLNTAASESSETFGTGELEAAIEGAATYGCDVPARGNPFDAGEVPRLARSWLRGWRTASELDENCICARQRRFWQGRAA